MATYGYHRTDYPRGWAMRGLNSPMGLGHRKTTLPVSKDNRGLSATIFQGQIMSVDPTGTHWVLGVPTDASLTNMVYIANKHSFDPDVEDADNLDGLACSGQFRYATPYFARTSGTDAATATNYQYTPGVALTYCKDTEEDLIYYRNPSTGEEEPTVRSLNGFVRPAAEGEPIIGYIAEMHTGVNADADATKNSFGAWALQQTFDTAVDSQSVPEGAYVIVFDTSFVPGVQVAPANP